MGRRMAGGRRRKGGSSWIGKAVITVALLAAPVGYGAYLLKDRYDHTAAVSREKAAWVDARKLVAARLKQEEPLEFGAVWATHTGRICGLVNGYGSFGGLSGMTLFYVNDGKATFAPDVTGAAFAPGWSECSRDNWVEVLPGSMETGYCATRKGRARCQAGG